MVIGVSSVDERVVRSFPDGWKVLPLVSVAVTWVYTHVSKIHQTAC